MIDIDPNTQPLTPPPPSGDFTSGIYNRQRANRPLRASDLWIAALIVADVGLNKKPLKDVLKSLPEFLNLTREFSI